MIPRMLFFIGKGGVGKSTSSALTSVFLSSSHRKTMLVSMDPAHNQRDIFEIDFSEKPMAVGSNLIVKEVDIDNWTQRYLKQTQTEIQKTYTYHSAFNLGKYFKILKYSPGLEEYALMMAFEDVIDQYTDQDVIVFDMAPTALSLKFFSLPGVTLIWLRELLKLRLQINAKKEIISTIRIGQKQIERDRVKTKLDQMIRSYERLSGLFLSDKVEINLVTNNEKLSLSEACRIKEKLAEIDISPGWIILNKVSGEAVPEEIRKAFPEQIIHTFPLSSEPVLGMNALANYVNVHENAFFSV